MECFPQLLPTLLKQPPWLALSLRSSVRTLITSTKIFNFFLLLYSVFKKKVPIFMPRVTPLYLCFVFPLYFHFPSLFPFLYFKPSLFSGGCFQNLPFSWLLLCKQLCTGLSYHKIPSLYIHAPASSLLPVKFLELCCFFCLKPHAIWFPLSFLHRN